MREKKREREKEREEMENNNSDSYHEVSKGVKVNILFISISFLTAYQLWE